MSVAESGQVKAKSTRLNKNGHLYCEMGKKEQLPARATFVQGSLWV